MYRLALITCLLTVEVGAQRNAYAVLRLQESAYQKLRTDQYALTREEYELKGPVKAVELTTETVYGHDTTTYAEHYYFSDHGLLTAHIEGDTMAIRSSLEYVYVAGTWFNYDEQWNLRRVRKRKYRNSGQTDEYLFLFDTTGFMQESALVAGRSYTRVTKLTYLYSRRDSVLSVKSHPQIEFDIEGNVLCDSVHFYFARDGRISKEHVFRFGSSEYISLTNNTYRISGRSYMDESGYKQYDSLGRLIVTQSSGFHINQRGQHNYLHKDSLVYDERGLLAAVYSLHHVTGDDDFQFFDDHENIPGEAPALQLAFRLEYTLDANGNWITRSCYTGNGALSSKSTRKISYY